MSKTYLLNVFLKCSNFINRKVKNEKNNKCISIIRKKLLKKLELVMT